MAFSATMDGYVRAGGDTDNAGFYNRTASGGTNYANQDLPEVEIDGSAVVGTVGTNTAHLDMSFYTVRASEVGNSIKFISAFSGTITTGEYEILSVDLANNRYVLDRACGTTGGKPVANLGGAKETLAQIYGANQLVTGNDVYVTGNLACASPSITLPAIANHQLIGRLSDADPTSPPVITLTSGFTLFTLSSGSSLRFIFRNFDFNGGDQASSRLLLHSGGDVDIKDCIIRGFRNNAINSSGRIGMFNCKIKDHTSSASTAVTLSGNAHIFGCEFSGNAVTPVTVTSNGYLNISKSLFRDNTGSSTDNLLSNGSSGYVIAIGCTFDAARRGFSASNGTGKYELINCLFTNATTGVYCTGATNTVMVDNCAFWGNTTDVDPGIRTEFVRNKITLSGDPYTDRTNDNYRPDDTSGEGASLIAAGYPLSFNGIDPRDFVGAMNQAAPSGGGAGTVGYGSME